MIKTLRISRFKSIKELALPCRRINVFIGRPNTGKSNILEALGMLSYPYYGRFGSNLRQFLRFEGTGNLFYDGELDHPVAINCDRTVLTLQFKGGRFEGGCETDGAQLASLSGDHADVSCYSFPTSGVLDQFKFYRFKGTGQIGRLETEFLLPPSGDNLLSLLLAHRELRDMVNLPFSSMGLRLGIRPQEGKLEVVKHAEDVIISYPYSLASETLQRLTFHVAAILSNKKSVLVFEEPESHSFPHYVNYLAELIALDQNENQYFISTHNPYFLMPLLAKAPKDDVSVNIVYYETYETKAKILGERDIQELMEIDVFSNLERFLEG